MAILAWGAAEIYWAVAIEGNPEAPYPSPADVATGTPLQIATTLAYPLGDIAMVAAVVGIVALTGWRQMLLPDLATAAGCRSTSGPLRRR